LLCFQRCGQKEYVIIVYKRLFLCTRQRKSLELKGG
jgi:hypothetical protein